MTIENLIGRAIKLPIDAFGFARDLVFGRSEPDRLRDEADEVRAQARKTEQQRKQQAATTARNVEERIDTSARRERLDALETRHEAVVDEAEAAAAADEAQRLKASAGRVKAARRS